MTAATLPTLPHATMTPRRSSARGHSDHGWLNTYHTFSFADYYAPAFQSFGSLRVLNEDRVAAGTGFPTHPHRDYEIFSYIVSGELTHRDSMHGKGSGANKDDFYVMKRGDVQFTTGGTGIAHSEQNEHPSKTVHFLQIWAKPWAQSLPPTYHTHSFPDSAKRAAFVPLLSPLAAGPRASLTQEKAAEPKIPGTIPVHADFVMGAAIVPVEERFVWAVGGGKGVVTKTKGRNVYVHVPMARGGRGRVRVGGGVVLEEGDGAFVRGVAEGDELTFESVGEVEVEVIVLDSD